MKRLLVFALVLACNDAARAPDPAGTLPSPSASTTTREDAAAPIASASATPEPDVDLAGAEAKCANAKGDVIVLSLLTSCPSGTPKNAVDCQGSYDGWDMWWGTDKQADEVRRAGCPTAILCERAFFSDWRAKHADAAREMIDHAEKRATPRPSGTPHASPRVYSCMF